MSITGSNRVVAVTGRRVKASSRQSFLVRPFYTGLHTESTTHSGDSLSSVLPFITLINLLKYVPMDIPQIQSI